MAALSAVSTLDAVVDGRDLYRALNERVFTVRLCQAAVQLCGLASGTIER